MTLDRLLTAILLYAVFPLWLLACAGDWICHRRSHIEKTSGVRESALHLLLYVQVVIAVLPALFLEITAAVLTIAGVMVLAHLACSVWDTSYSQPRRHISPLEQHVHAFQDLLPAFYFTLLLALHWNAVEDPEWRFALREPPLRSGVIAAVLVALALGLAASLEELVRCRRTAAHLET
jgi:hypothetical protein